MLKSLVATFQTVMGSSLSQQSAIDIISHWRSKPAHELLFDSPCPKIYFQAVDHLQLPDNIKKHSELMSVAMARLKREFHAVLSRQADYSAGPSFTAEWSTVTDSSAYTLRYEDYVAYEPLSKVAVVYLRNIAERMKKSGNVKECINLYKSVRKNFLQSQLNRLHFDVLRIGDSKRRFMRDELKVKMGLWIQVSKICVRILFEREKELCKSIFEGIAENFEWDECFVGTVQDFGVGLFSFVEAVTMSNQSYDKMETVLGLYDAFWSVLPNVNALFGSESGRVIKNSCADILLRIENEVGRMMYDLEDAVSREIPDSSDNVGRVHQTTEYVMLQIDVIVRNRLLLTNMIKLSPLLNFSDPSVRREDLGDGNRSFLDLHVILIFVILQRKLEMKSKSHKDPSLGNLFMMNNVRYIVQKIEQSNDLQEMIGDSFLKNLNDNVELAMCSYLELTCSKFMTCFQEKGPSIMQCFKMQPSKYTLRKRLKAFNAAFEEIEVSQSSCTIPDTKLKERIRLSLSEQLVPAYKNFLDTFRSGLEIKPLEKRNIKYLPQDLENLVLEKLFSNEISI